MSNEVDRLIGYTSIMDLICRRFIDLSSHYDVMSHLMMHDRVIHITSTISMNHSQSNSQTNKQCIQLHFHFMILTTH